MSSILENKIVLVFILLLVLFGGFSIYYLSTLSQIKTGTFQTLDEIQQIRELTSQKNGQTFVSLEENNGIGDSFVTVQGRLLQVINNNDENFLIVEISSYSNSPQLQIDLGPDKLKRPYVVSEILTETSDIENAELIERHSFETVDTITSRLQTQIGKTIKLQITTNTELTPDSPTCDNEICEGFLEEFYKYEQQNKALFDRDNLARESSVGAVFQIWEPYE